MNIDNGPVVLHRVPFSTVYQQKSKHMIFDEHGMNRSSYNLIRRLLPI